MEITAASFSHLDDICHLYKILFAEMAALQPQYYVPVEKHNVEFLKEIICGEQSDILVALIDSRVSGLVLLKAMHTLLYPCLVPHSYVYLMDLVVDPARRDSGIGTALLHAAKQWGQARRLDYVELGVLPENLRAISLYEREGFQAVTQTMRFSLD